MALRGAGAEASHPLELELLEIVICLMWVLGIEARFCAKTVHTLNP